MKNQSSKLTFWCQGRRRRIYRPKSNPHGPFYVRFRYKGKDCPRSLGTTLPQMAIEKAKEHIEAAFAGNVQKALSLRVRSAYPNLREVAEVYLENYSTDARRRRTARGNVGALEKIVRLGAAGLTLENARASVLTGELVRRYQTAEEKRIVRDRGGNMEPVSELRVRTTIGSVLRQARSIFKRSHMSWFESFVLPELESFRAQGVLAPERPKPKRLDDGVIEAIEADAPRLARERPAVYVAFLLFSQAGLRNKEIKAARKTWLRRQPDGSGVLEIAIRPNEGFAPKKGTEGMVPISAAVLEELLRLAEPEPDGFLVPAATKTERTAIVDREHSHWVGQWIKDRSKTSYELRRYAGSLYFDQVKDITMVQQFLRHRDLSTTMKWYWYRLRELQPLEAPRWLTGALPVAA